MAKVDVVVIGAGGAGLTAAALLAKEGKSVAVVEASKHLGGRGMAVPDEGFKLNLGGHLLEDSGSGITKVFEYVGKELVHGNVSSDMPVWDHEKSRWGSIRDRYSGDKSELKKVIRRAGRHALRGARQMGRPAAARVDAPAHERPGRDRPLGVHLGARVHDRRLVRPLRLGQPLLPQDALRREAHGRLLVLAGAGLGRDVRRPARRRRRERRRGPDGHAGRDRDHREQHRQGGPPRARQGPSQRVPRGRGARGRLRDLHAAGLERAARGARVRAAGLVHGADQVPRPGPPADHVARPVPGDQGAGPRDRPARARDLAARSREPRVRLLLQPVGDGPAHRAGGRQPLRVRRNRSRVEGARCRLPAADVRALRGRPEGHVPGPARGILAPPSSRARPVLRRDPEARPRGHVPAALAGAERGRASTSRPRPSAAAASASTARRAPASPSSRTTSAGGSTAASASATELSPEAGGRTSGRPRRARRAPPSARSGRPPPSGSAAAGCSSCGSSARA